MLIFKDIDMENLEHIGDNLINLEGDMKEYMMNIYLNAIMMGGHIDLNEINRTDIINFLKFLEQYPADCLSMDTIEKQLIHYFDLNGIQLNNDNKKMFERCNLKLMYLYTNHNKMFNSLCYDGNYCVNDENDDNGNSYDRDSSDSGDTSDSGSFDKGRYWENMPIRNRFFD